MRKRHVSVVLIAIIILMQALSAKAKRIAVSIWKQIQTSELIVRADVGVPDDQHRIPIKIREVYKGDSSVSGQTLYCYLIFPNKDAQGRPQGMRGPNTGNYRLPQATKGVILFFGNGWQDSYWPVSNGYTKPEDMNAVKTLIEIEKIKSERGRLEALKACFKKGGASLHYYEQTYLIVVKEMRERENLPLILKTYKDCAIGKDAFKRPGLCNGLAMALSYINDSRVVPTLCDVARAENGASAMAIHALYGYNDIPGVTETMRSLFEQNPKNQEAFNYLKMYDDDPVRRLIEDNPKPQPPLPVNWQTDPVKHKQELMEAFQKGTYERDDWITAAQGLMPVLTKTEKDALRPLLITLVNEKLAKPHSYYANTRLAEVLRSLHHPSCFNALIMLVTGQSTDRQGPYVAIMAINELGSDARKEAAIQLVQAIRDYKGNDFGEMEQLYMALAWLGSPADYESARADADIHSLRAKAAEEIQPWVGLSNAENETEFILDLYEQIKDDHDGGAISGRRWLLARLGELKTPQVIPLIMGAFESRSGNSQVLEKIMIGYGDEITSPVLPLLSDSDNPSARRFAFNILSQVMGQDFHPYIQRMLTENNYGDKCLAIAWLRSNGTMDDLPLLLPMCDFWDKDLYDEQALGVAWHIRRRSLDAARNNGK